MATEKKAEVRRESLATRLASTASDDAFQRAVAEEDPLVDDCRVILRKPTGRRTMDDIHVVRSSWCLNMKHRVRLIHCWCLCGSLRLCSRRPNCSSSLRIWTHVRV